MQNVQAVKPPARAIATLFGFMLALMALPLFFAYTFLPKTQEVQLAIAIVLTVAVLIILITAAAAVYRYLDLAAPAHALGLPEGSVRAFIALLLIMVFIVFGIAIFRSIAGTNGAVLEVTKQEMATYADRISSSELNADGKTYTIVLRGSPVSLEARQLAQQLVTVLGTLVGTIAGFYFGSSTAITAARVATGTGEQDAVAITGVSPSNVPASKGSVDLVIRGKSFQDGALLRLDNSVDNITATVTSYSSSQLGCTVDLTGKAAAKWDVVVVNPDASSARLVAGFSTT